MARAEGKGKKSAPAGQTRRKPLRVALTGAAFWFGRLLTSALAADPRVEKIICLDIADPGIDDPKVLYSTLDLTNPVADRLLSDILTQEKVNAFVHLAFPITPTNDHQFAHELTVIGTIHALNACAAVGIKRLVALSSTMVYGALPDNPIYLNEDAALRAIKRHSTIKDLVEAEHLLARYRTKHADASVAVVRPCTMMGPHSEDFMARYLQSPIVTTLLGFDPLFQFVHEQDAVNAFAHCLLIGADGAFNLTGEGVVLLSSAIKILGNINVPLTRLIAGAAARMLWQAGLSGFAPEHLDRFRFSLIADGSKIRSELNFSPQLNTRQTLSGVPVG